MDCLAILDSGNYAVNLCRIMEQKGYLFEVVSIPCHIAKNGCGYCIKLPLEHKDILVKEGLKQYMPIREIYCIHQEKVKYKYEKIYP